nr:hypothetical protein HXH02_25030 [Escherichia coli]
MAQERSVLNSSDLASPFMNIKILTSEYCWLCLNKKRAVQIACITVLFKNGGAIS